jgi:hypothetical protein
MISIYETLSLHQLSLFQTYSVSHAIHAIHEKKEREKDERDKAINRLSIEIEREKR